MLEVSEVAFLHPWPHHPLPPRDPQGCLDSWSALQTATKPWFGLNSVHVCIINCVHRKINCFMYFLTFNCCPRFQCRSGQDCPIHPSDFVAVQATQLTSKQFILFQQTKSVHVMPFFYKQFKWEHLPALPPHPAIIFLLYQTFGRFSL